MWLLTICSFLLMSIVDWPQFRGPNSDGRAGEAAIPTEWSESKNIAWRVPIEGLGWSSPVVAEGRVFLTTAITKGETLSLRAIALDAASGRMIWERELRSVTPVPHNPYQEQPCEPNSYRAEMEWCTSTSEPWGQLSSAQKMERSSAESGITLSADARQRWFPPCCMRANS